MLPPALLDHRVWICETLADNEVIASVTLSHLAQWHHYQPADTGYLRLYHTFHLAPLDVCVSYHLHFADVPAGLVVYINGRNMNDYLALETVPASPLTMDITLFVTLDDNQLVLEVPAHASGALSGVTLQALPCE